MSEQFQVDAPTTLLVGLAQKLPGWSRKKLKERLRLGCVAVNGERTTQHDHVISPDDAIAVHPLSWSKGTLNTPAGDKQTNRRRRAGRLEVLYSDDDYIAIAKPPGLLSVSTERERHKTALAIVRQSLGRRARLWPVHRLDRETSGVLMFAKSKLACDAMKAVWKGAEKQYVAIVEGLVKRDKGVVTTALWEDKNFFVYTSDDPPPQARDARTRWEVIKRGKARTLVRVYIETGRKHQIRVHLLSLGHPVVGDSRYGRSDKRLGLHARELSVDQPQTGARLHIVCPAPRAFEQLL